MLILVLNCNSTSHPMHVFRPYNFSGLAPPDSAAAAGPWAIDASYQGNLPAGNDFFMQLCDAADTSPGLPPHCAAVQHREKPFAYISLADVAGRTTIHGHRGMGTKFFTYGNQERAVGRETARSTFPGTPPSRRSPYSHHRPQLFVVALPLSLDLFYDYAVMCPTVAHPSSPVGNISEPPTPSPTTITTTTITRLPQSTCKIL